MSRRFNLRPTRADSPKDLVVAMAQRPSDVALTALKSVLSWVLKDHSIMHSGI